MRIAVFVARVLLGGLLVVAGVLKVGHPVDLATAIGGFRLLPAAFVGPLALALPYFELLLGAYLIAGLFVRAAGIVASVQFVVYAGAIASAGHRRRRCRRRPISPPATTAMTRKTPRSTSPHGSLRVRMPLITVAISRA